MEWNDIVPFTAQDEVCQELWDVLQALKKRTLVVIADASHEGQGGGFTQEVDDMIYLTSRAGDSYRYHAEKLPRHYGIVVGAALNAAVGAGQPVDVALD